MIKNGWVPLHSPYCLIQEHLFPNEWLILTSCILLNQTSRKQLERVFKLFTQKFPNPESLLSSSDEDLICVIRSLGFSNKRSKLLKKFSRAYVSEDWKDAIELPGIGDYASRAHQMFCLGEFGRTPPNDGALKRYWMWVTKRRT